MALRILTLDASVPDEPASAEGSDLLERLLAADLLVPTGVDGLYGRSAAYQAVADGVSIMVCRWSKSLHATRLRFPPLLARATFAHTNYLESFPDLMGSVHVFSGGNVEHKELLRRVESHGNWPALLDPAEVVVASATCHAVYPLCTGTLPSRGRYFDVSGWCFRHEPSRQATRMQSFVMHEVVHVGTADGAWEHRETGLAHGLGMLGALGLELEAVPASDPFFGRVGSVLAAGQLDEQLKVEGVTAIAGTDGLTAVMSANCHKDHFGRPFAILAADGETAHSACVAFGVDRITVALFARHGFDPWSWSRAVRAQLGL
jgi:seryl-tRNA synthetase